MADLEACRQRFDADSGDGVSLAYVSKLFTDCGLSPSEISVTQSPFEDRSYILFHDMFTEDKQLNMETSVDLKLGTIFITTSRKVYYYPEGVYPPFMKNKFWGPYQIGTEEAECIQDLKQLFKEMEMSREDDTL